MSIKEIKNNLVGKTISCYDGLLGSSCCFRIGNLEKSEFSIRLFPDGGGYGATIPIDILPQLIETGCVERYEFEWSTYKSTWRLL